MEEQSQTASPIPSQPPLSQIPTRKPLSLFKKIFIIVVGTVCLFGVWGTLFPDKTSNTPTTKQSATRVITPTMVVNWKTYTNKKYDYTVDYPVTLTISQKIPESILFGLSQKDSSAGLFPSLYITVLPAGNMASNTQIYNFMSADLIASFSAMKDGETKQTQTDVHPEYWTYQKLATVPVAGTHGIIIQNNKVWMGGGKLRDRRIIFKKKGITYIIGSYYQTQSELNDLYHFLTSFNSLQK